MNTLFVTVRVVHFASVMLLFGELVFVIGVAEPVWRSVRKAILGGDELSRWSVRIAVWSLIASIPSGIAWLVIEAAGMSGMPLAQALNRTTVGLVLGTTVFGQVWLLRLAIGLGLGVLLPTILVARNDRRRSRLALAATVLAAVYLGTLAWAGHAVGGSAEDFAAFVRADYAKWGRIVKDSGVKLE